MVIKSTTRYIALVSLFFCMVRGLAAQDESFALLAEQDIGYQCVVATALQPQTGDLWVLRDDCTHHNYFLQKFDPAAEESLQDIVVLSEINNVEFPDVWSYYTPLAFTPDGRLEFIIVDSTSESFVQFVIDQDSGELISNAESDTRLNNLLRQFTQYATYATVFNADHTRAAVTDEVKTTILDLTTGKALFEVDAVFNTAAFSYDGQRLYLSVLEEPDNYENFDTNVLIYNLQDGELTQSLSLPFGDLFPSPDGRYIALVVASSSVGEEQIGVVEVATGSISPLLEIRREPTRVLNCANNGKDVSDLDYRTSGEFVVNALYWLPQNSGFFTFNSPFFQVDSSNCYFDYSRLRQYSFAGS